MGYFGCQIRHNNFNKSQGGNQVRTLEQVKGLIVQGLSNKEIADICCITTGGVKYHVTNLLKEYGVNNRSKLINEMRKSQILTEGIDVTHPNLKLVNVEADFERGIRPTPFSLKAGHKTGFIETEIEIVRSVKLVQALHLYVGQKRKGVAVEAFVKRPTETTWVPLTELSLL